MGSGLGIAWVSGEMGTHRAVGPITQERAGRLSAEQPRKGKKGLIGRDHVLCGLLFLHPEGCR